MSNLFFDSAAPESGVAAAPSTEHLQTADILPGVSVILKVNIQAPGFVKTISSRAVMGGETSVDPTMIKTQKKLIDPAYMKPIQCLDSELRRKVREFGFKPEFVGDGAVVLPINLVSEAAATIRQYQVARESLIQDFLSKYESAKDDARMRNGDLFHDGEYASGEELSAQFGIKYTFWTITVPPELEGVDQDLYEMKQNEMEDEMAAGAVQCEQELVDSFSSLVTNLYDKVKGLGTERKLFKPGFVESLRTYLRLFDAKNITQHASLSALVYKTRDALDGVSPERLRSDLELRVRVEKELLEVVNALPGLTATRNVRYVSL